MDKKIQPLYILSTRDPPQTKDILRLKVKGWKNIPCIRSEKKTGVVILTSDKIDFKTKTITREREGH